MSSTDSSMRNAVSLENIPTKKGKMVFAERTIVASIGNIDYEKRTVIFTTPGIHDVNSLFVYWCQALNNEVAV